MWEAPHGKCIQSLGEHSGAVSAIAWNPGGEILIGGSTDGMLHWRNVQSGACLQARQGHQGTVQALKVSPDGSRLASCGNDGAIVLWDRHRGEPLQTLQRHRPSEQLNITRIKGLSNAQKASLQALGAFEDVDLDR